MFFPIVKNIKINHRVIKFEFFISLYYKLIKDTTGQTMRRTKCQSCNGYIVSNYVLKYFELQVHMLSGAYMCDSCLDYDFNLMDYIRAYTLEFESMSKQERTFNRIDQFY
jgi:hypothetical protein